MKNARPNGRRRGRWIRRHLDGLQNGHCPDCGKEMTINPELTQSQVEYATGYKLIRIKEDEPWYFENTKAVCCQS